MALAAKMGNKTFSLFVNIIFFINNWGFIASYIVLVNKLTAKMVETYIPSAPFFLQNPNGIFWACFIMCFLVFPRSLSYITFFLLQINKEFNYNIKMKASLARTLKALRFSFIFG